MEETGKLLVYGTRSDAELVVQTLYGILPKYGRAFINGSAFYDGAYEVQYVYSGNAIERYKIKTKICLACRTLRQIPRIKAIKRQ